MIKVNEKVLDKAVEFVMKYSTYESKETLKEVLRKHFQLWTILVKFNLEGEVIGLCRWNIMSNEEADILDLIIHPDYRRTSLMLDMAVQGLKFWNEIKYFRFERGYDDGKKTKEKKRYNVQQLLRRMRNVQRLQGALTV